MAVSRNDSPRPVGTDLPAADPTVQDTRITGLAWLLAILGPIAVAAALIPLRGRLDATNVALTLVVVVVAVAALARRLPGIVAAIVAGVAYDIFWTSPLYRPAINNANAIRTAVLLVAVGAAVSELAWYGHRAQRRAARSRGYLAGAVEIISTLDTGASIDGEIAVVEGRVAAILGADSCRYHPRPVPAGTGVALLAADGSIQIGGRRVDAGRGLPTDRPIVVPVFAGGQDRGHLEVVAASRWSRPSTEQRQVAVLLAGQLGEALSRRVSASG